MKTVQLLTLALLMMGISQVKASSMVKCETNPTTDTSSEVKNNNVAIFKLIPAPVTNSSNNSGSLKKAGKVARTSYSHSTSIENIIYKKKGI
jgi:hypothetical protein